jgi:hypothetical protein
MTRSTLIVWSVAFYQRFLQILSGPHKDGNNLCLIGIKTAGKRYELIQETKRQELVLGSHARDDASGRKK